MDTAPWHATFFGEEYFRVYAPFLPEERTAREVEGIVRLLGLAPGSTILDLACGHGRHAIPLAERGYRVTGQDLSEVFLSRARADAAARGLAVRWVRQDIRGGERRRVDRAAQRDVGDDHGGLQPGRRASSRMRTVARRHAPACTMPVGCAR